MVAKQRMTHYTLLGHMATRAVFGSDGTDRGVFASLAIVASKARSVEGRSFVRHVAVRVVASRAVQVSETLIEAPAQYDPLAREPHAVRRVFKQAKGVEVVILRGSAVASSAHLCLWKTLQTAGLKNGVSERLPACRRFDVLQARAVAPFAENPHLLAGRSLPSRIISGRVTTKALSDLFVIEFPAKVVFGVAWIVPRGTGCECDVLKALVPCEAAFHQSSIIPSANRRDTLDSAPKSPFQNGHALLRIPARS